MHVYMHGYISILLSKAVHAHTHYISTLLSLISSACSFTVLSSRTRQSSGASTAVRLGPRHCEKCFATEQV